MAYHSLLWNFAFVMLVADSLGRTDGTAFQALQGVNSPLPMLLVSRVENFQFNESIRQLEGKKWVLIDFMELGWDFHWRFGHKWGHNTNEFDFLQGEEWKKLDDFIRDNPPVLTLCRELLKIDVRANVKPIEYPCLVPIPEPDTKEQFEKRPINCFWFWGRSHELRLKLHGDIWLSAYKNGGAVCDNIYSFKGFMENENNPDKWVTLHIPHYSRVDIGTILNINRQSKISVNLFGAGKKCFRMSEASSSSVMIMQHSDLAYTYEWLDGINCSKFSTDNPDVEIIRNALTDRNIYDIYREGVETCKKYQLNRYISEYIEPTIKQFA